MAEAPPNTLLTWDMGDKNNACSAVWELLTFLILSMLTLRRLYLPDYNVLFIIINPLNTPCPDGKDQT